MIPCCALFPHTFAVYLVRAVLPLVVPLKHALEAHEQMVRAEFPHCHERPAGHSIFCICCLHICKCSKHAITGAKGNTRDLRMHPASLLRYAGIIGAVRHAGWARTLSAAQACAQMLLAMCHNIEVTEAQVWHAAIAYETCRHSTWDL